MRQIVQTKQFKRDYRKIAASGRYALKDFLAVVELLAQDKPLPEKYRNHALVGPKVRNLRPAATLVLKL